MLVLNHATFPNFSVPIVFVWILKGLLFIVSCNLHMGFPGGSDGKESSCNAEDLSSIPGLGWFPGRGRSNPLQCSCLENSHGQRSLAGYSPWDHKVRQDWAAKHSTTQSAYDDNFTSYLPFWMLLFNFFFSFLTVVARTSSTMLNRSGKRGYPCLISDFSRKIFSFSLLCWLWIYHK